MERTKKHMFVCGCPRSGTTAFRRLLIADDQIVLGLERYAHFSFKDDLIKPDLFEKERFFQIREGETFYTDLRSFVPEYGDMCERYDDAIWIGDKIPTLYLDYDGIERNFDGAIIFFLLRNIVDVANSYQKRANDVTDATWSRSRGVDRAVRDWNQSLMETARFLRRAQNTRLYVVGYEEIFLQRSDIGPIFAQLELPLVAEVNREYTNLLARSQQLIDERGCVLTSMQRQYVVENARTEFYRELLQARLQLPAANPTAINIA